MTEDERRELARSGGVIGGKARAGALTKRRRTAIAKAAAAARWSKQKRDWQTDRTSSTAGAAPNAHFGKRVWGRLSVGVQWRTMALQLAGE